MGRKNRLRIERIRAGLEKPITRTPEEKANIQEIHRLARNPEALRRAAMNKRFKYCQSVIEIERGGLVRPPLSI